NQQQTQQTKIEDALFDQRVEKDRRRVGGQEKTRRHAGAARKQFFSDPVNQRAGERAENDLDQAYQPKVVPEENLQGAEKIGIQRRLIENSLSHPVAGGAAVAGQVIKKRDRLDLRQVDHAQRQGGKNNRRRPAKRAGRMRRARCGPLALGGGLAGGFFHADLSR